MNLTASTPGARPARAACWLAVACALLLVPQARADEHIWSALVVANQVDKPKALPAELTKIGAKIQHIFGCNQLEIVGSATKTIDEEYERWLVPTQNFFLCVKSKRQSEGMYMLDLKIFQDKRCLVETQAKLAQNSPLLIRGPMHERGQLIIVLQVQP